MSTAYLIHFDKPYRHAQHYIGVTNLGDVADRINRHLDGNGSNLCRVAKLAGIEMQMVRVWFDMPRKFEVRLKNRGSARRICPLCKDAYNAQRRAKHNGG